jgi:hypothetical protein
MGCNLSSLSYILAGAPEPECPADGMELTIPKDKKEMKVVVLAYSAMAAQAEFVTAERELSGLICRQLRQACQLSDQKIVIVPPNKVQEFKNNNPDWHHMKLQDIGRRFGSDYVIFLDIESLSLYERGSSNQLFRGRAEISVTLVNMHDADDDPLERHFSCAYPETRGPIPVDDQNAREFYMSFLNYMAKHITWYFVPHATADTVCE